MATAVTLKESDGTDIYPVTDISLVNNGIHAVDAIPTTEVPPVTTSMIEDGAVTSAKIDWPSFPKFNAYYDTTYPSFPADTPIPFNSAQVNIGGFTLNNTGQVTIPKSGYYMITVQLWVQNSGSRSWWRLRRNGNNIGESIISATGYWGLTAISNIYQCTQGDVIDVIKNGSDSVNLNSGSADKRTTSISIRYIG